MATDRSFPSAQQTGFTLIELLVSLALFAMISLAGVSLIETTVGVQQRTAGRAERLADVQRALFLIAADFEQLTAGPESDLSRTSLQRASADGGYTVEYFLADQSLHRVAAGSDRVLLQGVTNLQWRFWRQGTWSDQAATEADPQRPTGVELTLQLERGTGGIAGSVRRVLELPAE